MASSRTRWLGWTAVLCWLLFAASAHATVSVAGPPAGWATEPSPDATARAAEWAELLRGRVNAVFSTHTGDEFSETLAVLTLPGAMSPNAPLDPGGALEDAVGAMFEEAPTSPLLYDGSDAPVVTGRFEQDGLTYDVAVVSAGPNRGAIILAVRSAERSLYSQVFDEALEGLSGSLPPLVPFEANRLRIGGAIGWGIALVLGWVVMASTGRGREGAAAVGRGVAVLLIFLALVAAGFTYATLEGAEPQLQLASVSRFRMATEVAMGGMLAALVAWFIGALRDSTVRRVESAPTGGSFSSSAVTRTLTSNLVPPTQRASLTDPGHGMTADDLERVDKLMMEKRKPQATLVGAPSLASATAGGDPAFDEVWAQAQAAAEAEAEAQAVEAEAPLAEEESQDEADVSNDDVAAPSSVPEETNTGARPTTQRADPNFELPKMIRSPGPPDPDDDVLFSYDEPPKPKRKSTESLLFPPPMTDRKSDEND